MPGEQIKLGLIGCGNIGRRHASACSAVEGIDLVATCDVIEGRAREVAQQYGLDAVYGTVQEMLDGADLDAVSVCTPHKEHHRPTLAAIERGLHVIVEKPLSTSLVEADEMVQAAEKADLKLGAIFQRRFFPAAQRMKRAILDGRLGTLTTGECIAQLGRNEAYFGRDKWRGTWAGEGGGALMNQAVHMIDMLLWAMGPATEVYGRWATLKHGAYIDVEDTAVATVSFENGALATIQATTTLDPAFGFRLAVHGTSGDTVGVREWPELSQGVTDLWTFRGEEELRRSWEAVEAGQSGFPHFHALQLQDFGEAIREGRDPAVTGREGRNAVELIKGVYLSESRRVPVRLPMSGEDIAACEALGCDKAGWQR